MANLTLDELARRQSDHDKRLDAHAREIDSLMLWRAEVKGSLRTLTYLVGIGLAGPGGILAWAVVTGRLAG